MKWLYIIDGGQLLPPPPYPYDYTSSTVGVKELALNELTELLKATIPADLLFIEFQKSQKAFVCIN